MFLLDALSWYSYPSILKFCRGGDCKLERDFGLLEDLEGEYGDCGDDGLRFIALLELSQ